MLDDSTVDIVYQRIQARLAGKEAAIQFSSSSPLPIHLVKIVQGYTGEYNPTYQTDLKTQVQLIIDNLTQARA